MSQSLNCPLTAARTRRWTSFVCTDCRRSVRY